MLAVAPVDRVSLVRRLMQAAQAKSDDVSSQLHPAWIHMAWQRAGIAAPTDATAARCRAALAGVYDLQWPTLSRFRLVAHRIALLPRTDLLRVLGAIALHLDRERVRLSIGHGLRAAIIDHVGDVAYAGIVAACRERVGPPVGSLAVSEIEPEALAARGLAALAAHGDWHSKRLMAWVRMALAPALLPTAAVADRTAAADTAGALQRLSLYFPEHAWLFGSPMDRALSASTTA